MVGAVVAVAALRPQCFLGVCKGYAVGKYPADMLGCCVLVFALVHRWKLVFQHT